MEDRALAHLREWVGRTRADEDVIAARHACLMAATVGYPAGHEIADGMALPALWHWIYFLEAQPPAALGHDGHPARGDFLPPVPLPHRMWAGGRIEMPRPIVIGSRVRRSSQVLRVDHKQGKSGDLIFVTVAHEISTLDGERLLREEHDIVYTAATARAQPAPAPAAPLPGMLAGPRIVPDPVLLFRYSALTFNGHRIHYDLDYCRWVERYENLVVHGPLNATLLARHAESISGRRLLRFDYRLLAPAFVGDTLALEARAESGWAALRMLRGDGVCCAEATAHFAP